MKHLPAQCLGMDSQVADNERLEQEAQQIEVGQQLLWRPAERRDGERRIDEVTLVGNPRGGAGSHARAPCRLVLEHHQALERRQVVAYRVIAQGPGPGQPR